ncbi:MAG: glycosyltransferase family 2 protein [Alphaproteobacteria bacterium]
MTPAVSVVIPVHDGARFLAQAVHTVRDQGMADVEIVVVDDGSADATARIAAGLAADPANRLRVVSITHGGPSAARNAGIAAARGGLLAFLDVDDSWPPGRLALLRRRLAADPALDFVHGTLLFVHDDPADGFWAAVHPQAAPMAMPASFCTGLYRRRVFDAVGPLDEELSMGEDTDWFLRATEMGRRYVVLDCVVLYYRLHGANLTRDREATKHAIRRVITRSVMRRRRTGVLRPLPAPSDFLEAVTSEEGEWASVS